MKEFEIYDEASGKTLNIKANSLEEAETISEGIDFDDYEDGDFVMAKGGEVDENRMAIQKHRNKLVSVDDYLSPNKFEWYAAEIYDANDGETLYHSLL